MAKQVGGAHSTNLVRGVKERVKQAALKESELLKKADEFGLVISHDGGGKTIRREPQKEKKEEVNA